MQMGIYLPTLSFIFISLFFGIVYNLNMTTVIQVTKAVVKKYNVACVYLLYSTKFKESEYMKTVLKHFSCIDVFMASKLFEDVSYSLNCNYHQPLYVMATDDTSNKEALIEMSVTNDLPSGRWLLFLELNASLEKFFRSIYIPFDCEFLVAQQLTGSEDAALQVTLTEVYHIHPTLPLQTYHIANFSTDNSSWVWTAVPFHIRRKHLHGVVLRCLLAPEPPYIVFNRNEDTKPEDISGYAIELWKVLQQYMKFRTDYQTPARIYYGSRYDNGSWGGMVGEVVENRADVAINFFFMTAQRASVVDFFPPIVNTKMVVFVKKPGMDHSTLKNILSEFSPGLWKAVILTMLGLSAFLSFTWYFGLSCSNHQDPLTLGLADSYFYTHGILCQQSHYTTPKSWPCRLVYISIYITALVLFVAYSATFISILAIRRLDLPFESFESMLEDGTYSLGVPKNSERESFFKRSNVTIFKQIYKKLIAPYNKDVFGNDAAGLRRVCKEEKYGYFCAQTIFRGLPKKLPCIITEIPQAYFSTSLSMIIGKSSPYKRIFKHHLQEMRRAGILKRTDKLTWNKHFIDNENEDFHPSVTFGTIEIFFKILSIGVVLSIFVLLMEIISYKLYCDKRRKRSYKLEK